MVDNYAESHQSHNFEKWLNGVAIAPNIILNEKQKDINSIYIGNIKWYSCCGKEYGGFSKN